VRKFKFCVSPLVKWYRGLLYQNTDGCFTICLIQWQ